MLRHMFFRCAGVSGLYKGVLEAACPKTKKAMIVYEKVYPPPLDAGDKRFFVLDKEEFDKEYTATATIVTLHTE